MNWAVWGLPLVILLLGLVVGAVIVLRLKGSSGNDQQDLQETKDALLDQLRQLNVDRARMNAVEFQQRRELLLEAAATTLREMDNPTASDVGQETGTSAATSPSTPMQKMGWSAVALCITGGLVWLVVLAAQPRGDGSLTGASIGGEDPMAAIVAAREERMAGATAALEANPQDMNALNVLTYEALLVRDLELAMEYMETSREIDPDHPEVMVHLAILQMSIGMPERAMESLEQAILAQPTLGKALLWRGFLRNGLGDADGAIADLQASQPLVELVEEQHFIASLLQELTAEPAEERLSGIVSIPEGAAPPEGATLFVIVRRLPQAEGGGPPVAVHREANVLFPFEFSITDEQMFMGGEWPEKVWIHARYDEDGNAMTRGEGDWESELIGPLATGVVDISLLLQP